MSPTIIYQKPPLVPWHGDVDRLISQIIVVAYRVAQVILHGQDLAPPWTTICRFGIVSAGSLPSDESMMRVMQT